MGKPQFLRSNQGFLLSEVMMALGMLGILIFAVISTSGFFSQMMKSSNSQAGVNNAVKTLSKTLMDPTSCKASLTPMTPLSGTSLVNTSMRIAVKYGSESHQDIRGPASVGIDPPVQQRDFGIEVLDLKIDFPAQSEPLVVGGLKSYFGVVKFQPRLPDNSLGGSQLPEKIIGTITVKTNAAMDTIDSCGGSSLVGMCGSMAGVYNQSTGKCELDKLIRCPAGQIQTGNNAGDCIDPQAVANTAFSSCPAGSVLIRNIDGDLECQTFDDIARDECQVSGVSLPNGLLVADGGAGSSASCLPLRGWNARSCGAGQVLVSNGDGTANCRTAPAAPAPTPINCTGNWDVNSCSGACSGGSGVLTVFNITTPPANGGTACPTSGPPCTNTNACSVVCPAGTSTSGAGSSAGGGCNCNNAGETWNGSICTAPSLPWFPSGVWQNATYPSGISVDTTIIPTSIGVPKCSDISALQGTSCSAEIRVCWDGGIPAIHTDPIVGFTSYYYLGLICQLSGTLVPESNCMSAPWWTTKTSASCTSGQIFCSGDLSAIVMGGAGYCRP